MTTNQEKILNYLLFFLLSLTGLSSLLLVKNNYLSVFLFIFFLLYWQRKRQQSFFQKIKNPKGRWIIYLLTGWLGAIILEFSLGISPFHPRPIANYLVGMGFYLPYFALWLVLIKRYQFTFLEIFYLSGFGKVIFDILITHKLLIAASVATSVVSAFLIFFIQTVVILVLFGALTTLPALYLTNQDNKNHNKPLKQYLIGLTPGFLGAGVFVVWTIILRIIFKT